MILDLFMCECMQHLFHVFIMGYVTFSLGCYMVCCSVASLAVGYIYLSCSHLYSFASYDRPYALKIMSDVEDVTPANTDFPSSDVLLPSLPKQPLSQSLEASVRTSPVFRIQ